MPTATATCPSNEDLKAYAWGGRPSASEDQLADHLDSCRQCEAAVQTLERQGDPLLARLRKPVKPDPYQQEPECRQVVDRLLDDTVSLRGKPASSVPAALPPLTCPGPFREYDLLEILGEGGMGTVYKARHRKLNKLAAIKILPAAMAQDPERIARFKREMKAIGQLDHTHIVRALDAGEAEGRHYLALEYVEGLDLSKVSDRAGRLSVADACEVVRQVAVGLRAADEQGLIHRDIKPSNLMLTPKGHVKILDLGLAVFETDRPQRGETTAYGQIVGTPDYIAPEQINDAHSVDARADIYSLGCTLYKLLTGQAPFSGPRYKSHAEKMAAHLRDPIPSIRLLLPKAPEKLAALIDRMVAKDRDLRIPKPGQVVEALASFCAGADLVRLAGARSEEQGAGSGQVSPRPHSGEGGHHVPMVGVRASSEPASPNLPSPAGSSATAKDAKKTDFDPYHKWLGIPAVEQPPTHYRLLGLQAFEGDSEVILGAVMRQSAHLKTFQLGQHAALTQKILNEVSAAKVCLLDPQRKAAYDDRLRKDLEAREKASRVVALPKAKPLPGKASPAAEPIPLENPEIIPEGTPKAISTGSAAVPETGLADLFDQIGIAAPLESSSANGGDASSAAAKGNAVVSRHFHTGKGHRKSQASLWQRCVAAIPPRYRTRGWLAAAGGAAFLVVGGCTAVLIVSVRDKNGNEVARVNVPEGGSLFVGPHDVKKPKATGTQSPAPLPKVANDAPKNKAPEKSSANSSPAPPLAIAPFDAAQAKAHQAAWAKHLAVRAEITNSVGTVLIFCPPGKFTMGSPTDENDRSDSEGQVPVTISKGFYLGRYSVTQAEFKAVMDRAPWAGKPQVYEGNDYPATYVDWNDAAEYCRKLNECESRAGRLPPGYRYDLPTEAQREYACRAGTTTAYSFGNDLWYLNDYAWWRDNASGNGRAKPEPYAHRSGQKRSNAWGFFDLHGNVWEWCRDVFANELPGGTDPLAASGSDRVTRGGSWGFSAKCCRSAFRGKYSPSTRWAFQGFRLALAPTTNESSQMLRDGAPPIRGRPATPEGAIPVAAAREAKNGPDRILASPQLQAFIDRRPRLKQILDQVQGILKSIEESGTATPEMIGNLHTALQHAKNTANYFTNRSNAALLHSGENNVNDVIRNAQTLEKLIDEIKEELDHTFLRSVGASLPGTL